VCWGDNTSQQLGVGAGTDALRMAPVTVVGADSAIQVAAGGAHTCTLYATGEVRCWGANDSGQLGDDSMNGRPTPVPVTNLTGGTSISAGRSHSCARTQSGTRCWGNNQYGQLGDGTQMNRLTPVTPQ
jgi:alpha-tubulin suppressor-like RCC1 family protein